MDYSFPDKLNFLFTPKRYKVAYGGRGSSKSWSFARALLLQGASSKLRILCTREVQKSIKDSVHKLLSDQILELGLTKQYEIFDNEIRGRNGTEIFFAGLSGQTVDSIKSYEGVDRVWVEEAQAVSKRSWDILIPTIRKDLSEIWVTFNPSLDTDDTYKRFVTSPPPNAFVAEVNYHDNPWFPSVLEDERLHCQITNKEDYDQIWLGKCRKAIAGAIYAGEISAAFTEERITRVPYDPRYKVHSIWDLGFNDAMAVIMAQRVRSEVRVIDYYEESHKTIEEAASFLNTKNYNWGDDWLPHDGYSKECRAGKSAYSILKASSRRPRREEDTVPRVSVENGIKAARSCLRQTVFDKVKAARLVECLKRYRRSINQQTQTPGAPLHDEFSNGADAFRYLGLVADKLKNEDVYVNPGRVIEFSVLDEEMGY